MGERLPVITGKELLNFYTKMGCVLKRIKGSYHVLQSVANKSMFVIPIHGNEELDRGLLRAIVLQSGFEIEHFIELWKQR